MKAIDRTPIEEAPATGTPPPARYWVCTSGIEVPIEQGQTLIGRGDDCDIRIRDHLVSRRHARIVRQGNTLVLQDLGSANGIFVNQKRVEDGVPISPGDQIFIGTCELTLFSALPDSDRPTDSGAFPADLSEDRPTPVSSVSTFLSQEPPPPSPRAPREEDVLTEQTESVNGLEYMGRLADKMFTMGRTDAARRILGGHLQELLDNARSGRPIESRMIDIAGRYAMKLASETLEGRWIDLAIELHTFAKKPMIEETIQQLATLRGKAPIGSAELLSRYEQVLRAQMAIFSASERILVERIACLRPESER